MRMCVVHFVDVGSTKTLCGRKLLKVPVYSNYSCLEQCVTCGSCKRILFRIEHYLTSFSSKK
jgi:hypothetical protein